MGEKLGNSFEVTPDTKNSKAEVSEQKEKNENMFGISWDEGRKRFMVRLLNDGGKPLFVKQFSQGRYGSKEKALREAIHWRNETCQDNLIPCSWIRDGIELKNNKTSVPGVYRKDKKKIYVATWYDDNRKLNRAEFSENKWGVKQAFFMAWATRLMKNKIFKKNKETKESILEPEQCFDVVYDQIGRDRAEKIWKKEKRRVEEIEEEIEELE